MMIDLNLYKVPKGQWKKWSPQAQRVFNYVYQTSVDNQSLFIHPKGLSNSHDKWKTTAWNMAWTAADAVMKA